jgi:hypothetical protein
MNLPIDISAHEYTQAECDVNKDNCRTAEGHYEKEPFLPRKVVDVLQKNFGETSVQPSQKRI